MPIVLASPVRNPDLVWAALGLPMTWTGVDGSMWDLADPLGASPGMGRGVQGLHLPSTTVFKSSTPLVPGTDLVGYSIDERTVYWPLIFKGKTILAWQQAYSAFFDSFHPVKTGIWTVGDGEARRELPLAGVFDGGYAFDIDPFTTGKALIGLELTAPRPLWRGKPITRSFGGESGVPFIPPEKAPTYYISPAATFGAAAIRNPGNEPAYLRYQVEGPLDLLQLGIGEALIDVPFPIPAGSTLRIDTDPASAFATLDDADATRALGFQMFAPVPAGGETPLTIVASGAGKVTVTLTPLYWRAF